MSALSHGQYMVKVAQTYGDLVSYQKLQILLYISQIEYLKLYNGENPYVTEEFEIQNNMPIIRSVYQEYACYGYDYIRDSSLKGRHLLTQKQRDHHKAVLAEYMAIPAIQLMESLRDAEPYIKALNTTDVRGFIPTAELFEFYKNKNIIPLFPINEEPAEDNINWTEYRQWVKFKEQDKQAQ